MKYSRKELVEFLHNLNLKGIRLELNDDKLRIVDTRNAVNKEIIHVLREYKQDIIKLMQYKVERTTAIPVVPRDIPVPLSFAQERLWFIDQYEHNISYNNPGAVRMKGNLDVAVLEKTFSEIIRRHEILRTNFVTNTGCTKQIIHKPSWCYIDINDLSSLSKESVRKRLAGLIKIETKKVFDLANDCLMRLVLYKISDNEHVLFVNIHHIISDGWSFSILLAEVSQLYEAFSKGELSPLPELGIQYADYAVWQREYIEGGIEENQGTYWRNKLQGVPFLELPVDRARPAKQTFSGGILTFTLEKDILNELKAFCTGNNVTLFMTVVSVFYLLLYRYTSQEDICVGTPIANRIRREIEPLIGFFANTLAIRCNISSQMSFFDLLSQVKKTTMDAYDNQDIPFEKVVDIVQPNRNLSFSPLFQVMFVLQNNPASKLFLNDLILEPIDLELNVSKFDMTLSVTEKLDRLFCEIEYNSDLFDKERIDGMARHFSTLIKSAITHGNEKLSQLELLPEEEREKLVRKWNATRADYPRDVCIHQLFEDQVRETPDSIAVVFGQKTLTYRELNERANQLARYLRTKGVGTESLVAICVERSMEMIIGLLGILKAGGAYVPVDPAYPEERIRYMLEDSGCEIILTRQTVMSGTDEDENRIIYLDAEWDKIGDESNGNIGIEVLPNNLVYVIYTSGSTGRPRGVMLKHENLINLVNFMHTKTNIDLSAVLQFTSLSFDVSAQEIFSTLLYGGKICLIQNENRLNYQSLFSVILENDIRTVFWPISFIKMLFADNTCQAIPGCIKHIITAGEQLVVNEKLNAYLKQNNVFLHNHYGPSETHVVTTFTLRPEEPHPFLPPIGRPIDNTQIYILDKDRNLVPAGNPGELYIGGKQLGRGYINNPGFTVEKFIPNPFSTNKDSKLYKTGDLVKYQGNGNMEFIGRIDNQVKIRGFRVEPGEVESALCQLEDIKEAVVIAREDASNNKGLVAYIVAKMEIDVQGIQEKLAKVLPDYMVPRLYVKLDKIPLLPNGKMNRKALPAAEANIEKTNEFIAPRSEMERNLAEIWSEVSGVEKIGINDNFFELGGHSLLAVKLLAGINHRFSTDIRVAAFFSNPTIAGVGILILKSKLQKLDLSELRSVLAAYNLDNNYRMNILLTMNLPYTRISGGANKSNRSLVEEFAKLGHSVKVVTPALAVPSDITHEEFLLELQASGIKVRITPVKYIFTINHVEVHAVIGPSDLKQQLQEEIKITSPDWVLVSTEDPSQLLLKAVHDVSSDNVIYLAHTPLMLPFGPYSLYPGASRTDLINKSREVVTISNYVSDYVETYAGAGTFVNHPPHFGSEVFRNLASFDNEYVLMVNPSAMKGISILLDLIKLFPDAKFAVVPGWGTTDQDKSGLQKYANVAFFEEESDLDILFDNVKILMVPSLCPEGFGMICVDAMLRGIPVVASDFGGLKEAKLGTDYLIPINPVTEYLNEYNTNSLPHAVIPRQNITLWKEALADLLFDEALYQKQSSIARSKSLEFVSTLSVAPLVSHLEALLERTADTSRIKNEILNSVNPGLLGGDDLRSFIDLVESKSLYSNIKNSNIDPVPVSDYYDVSYSQKQLLIFDELTGDANGNIISGGVVLEGKLDVGVIGKTFQAIVDRHESLRTVFLRKSGEFKQKILSHVEFNIEEADISSEADPRVSIQINIDEILGRRFDLYKDTLLRVRLIKVRKEKNILIFVMHHIISDGVSMSILKKEVFELFDALSKGLESPLIKMDIQYKDYAAWQNQIINSDDNFEHKEFWHNKLSGDLPILDLPLDKHRPPKKTYNGSLVSVALADSEIKILDSINRTGGVTSFITLLALVKIILYKYTHQEDIIIGTPISGRQNYCLKDQIGYYVNMLALRDRITGSEPFYDYLEELKKNTLAAFDHQEYPFELLVEELAQNRDASRSPIFDVLVSYEKDIIDDETDGIFPGKTSSEDIKLTVSSFEFKRKSINSSHDIAFMFNHTMNGLTLNIVYNTDLFFREKIVRLSTHFIELIRAVGISSNDIRIDDINILTEADIKKNISNSNKKIAFPVELLIHEWFEREVNRHPRKVACKFESGSISYYELNLKANQLAHRIRAGGIKQNDIIPLICHPGFDMIISILAILKSGAAYLAIDPQFPKKRIEYIINDCCCRIVLIEEKLKRKLELDITCHTLSLDLALCEKDGYNKKNPVRINTADNLAYVIYTSGSTGKPKGVMVNHSNAVSLFFSTNKLFDFNDRDVWTMFHSYCFDFSVWEIFGSLLNGGKLIIVPGEAKKDPDLFQKLLEKEKVTVLSQVPAAFYNFIENEPDCEDRDLSVRYVVLGGDKLDPLKLKLWKNKYPGIKIVNMYGITETTIHATYKEMGEAELADSISNIGKVLPNLNIYLLDKNRMPVPEGVVGEIYISGAGVSKGYLNNDVLTSERFINNPYNVPEKMYHTGDLAKYLPNGDLEYLSRIDDQVQLRGFRIELSEIEKNLRENDLISDAIVVIKENEDEDKFLCAYITRNKGAGDDNGKFNKDELKVFLSRNLPHYMIPSHFVEIDHLPLTANGKIDKKALPDPAVMINKNKEYAAPTTDIERRLMDIWCKILNMDNIGITDDFFEIGGHSLNAIKITSTIYKEFNVEIRLGDFFEHPRIKYLGDYIELMNSDDDVDRRSNEEVEEVLL